MLSLLNLTRVVYLGYRGDGEHHIIRVLLAISIAIIVAINPSGLSKDALSTMAVIVSVLAGFSFTALFSSHSHSTSDLPAAESESDRQDLMKLKAMFNNFRNRARYFLVISVLCLFAVLMISIHIDFNFIAKYRYLIPSMTLTASAYAIWIWLCFFVRFLALLMFLEILYSFYRLAETTFSILDIRKNYLESDR